MNKFARTIIALLLLTSGAHAAPAPVSVEELAGEELHFIVKWTGIKVANAKLTATLIEPGKMRFSSWAKSLSVIRWLYPLKSYLDSHVDVPALRPTFYHKWGREGWGNKHDRKVYFDTVAGISNYFKDGKPRKTIEIPADVQDPLSSFYYFRTSELSEEEPMKMNVSDGKRSVEGEVRFIGREEVTTPAGTFQTIKIEPIFEGVGGVFKKSPGARLFIWMTDDKWRRPVKMYSKVIIGDFTALLVRVVPPTQE